jgi:hypothetical protein
VTTFAGCATGVVGGLARIFPIGPELGFSRYVVGVSGVGRAVKGELSVRLGVPQGDPHPNTWWFRPTVCCSARFGLAERKFELVDRDQPVAGARLRPDGGTGLLGSTGQ